MLPNASMQVEVRSKAR